MSLCPTRQIAVLMKSRLIFFLFSRQKMHKNGSGAGMLWLGRPRPYQSGGSPTAEGCSCERLVCQLPAHQSWYMIVIACLPEGFCVCARLLSPQQYRLFELQPLVGGCTAKRRGGSMKLVFMILAPGLVGFKVQELAIKSNHWLSFMLILYLFSILHFLTVLPNHVALCEVTQDTNFSHGVVTTSIASITRLKKWGSLNQPIKSNHSNS